MMAVSARSKGRKGLYDGCGMLIGLDQRGGASQEVNDPREGLYSIGARILFQEPKSETTFLFEGGGSTDRLFSWCG